MKLRNKTIRVFLSSTFEDLKMERDALQQKAFHNLREYCRNKGWQFQAVDLRWGINNEATIDQRTMEICLREIARCQEQSPRPNFIILLGERYGWRPLPDRVLQSIAIDMEKDMPPNIQTLFKQWYELDENQLPEPVWKLRSREGRYIDYNTFDESVQKPLVVFFSNWAGLHLPDPDLLENANNPLAHQRLSMERSATEQEIHAGAFRVEDAKEHVFAFFRNITECPVNEVNHHDADQQEVQRLRLHLKSFLPENNISEFNAKWDNEHNQPDKAHLEKLSQDVEAFLKIIIDKEIELYQLSDEQEIEQAAHEAFAKERTFGFSGREKDIEAIFNFATEDHKAPLVVWGASGSGKSTLLAMAAGIIKEKIPHANVIARFIGVTGKSSNGHSLLTDICYQLCLIYGGDINDIPNEPNKLQVAFKDYLSKATSEKPLILFLDALDQLNENDNARKLQWFPYVLPPNVSIITSTLKVDCFDILKEREKPAPVFYEITSFTAEDGRYALDAWLQRAGRKLQTHQTEQIIMDFESAGCAPLYLHIAFKQALNWESYRRKERLGNDIPEIIETLYENLSRPEAHGSIVEKALTAIRCAKQGLSDDELLGILADDEEFWNSFGAQTYHVFDTSVMENKASRQIPPVLWIRLYHDLEFYLTRRNTSGGEVITFYHRQLAEAVDNIYLMRPGIRQKRHKELAQFFARENLLIKENLHLIANVRKCVELPWQLLKSEDWDALTETLCNLDFIQIKAAAKLTYELVNDFNAALEVIPDNAENIRHEKERQARMDKYTQDLIACAKGMIKIEELEIPESITPWTKEQIYAEIERIKTNPTRADRLKDFLNFLWQESSNLQNHAHEIPNFAYQQAWNFVVTGPVGDAAGNLAKEDVKTLLRFIPQTRPPWNPLPQVLQTLKGHTNEVTSVALTPDGKRAISGSADKTCILWDLQSGEALQTLKGHTNEVTSVALTPDGKRAISGSADKTCILWDLQSGQALQTFRGHTNEVTSVALTPDGERAISGSLDITCILWDLQSGEALQTLWGHTDEVTSVAITPDGKRAISGSDDYTCILWNLQRGKKLQKLRLHYKVNSVAITPDGKRAIPGAKDSTCFILDMQKGKKLQPLMKRNEYFKSVALTPDGKRVIITAHSWEKTCILWDLQSNKALQTLWGHIDEVLSVAITPDGKRAISGSKDSTCILWDLQSGIELQKPRGRDDSDRCVFTPDFKLLIFGNEDNICKLWDLRIGEMLKVFRAEINILYSFALTPDRKRLISGERDNVIFRDLQSIGKLQTLKGHSETVTYVALTPEGKRAISGSDDYTCIFWDLQRGEALQTLYGHTNKITSVTITPDGKRALSSSWDNTCILWDLQSGQVLQTLKGHTNKVTSVVITPDGKRAISSSYDKSCILWDLQSGQALQTLRGHTHSVKSVAFTFSGKRALSSSYDKSCILWDLQTGHQLAKVITNYVFQAVAPYANRVAKIELGASALKLDHKPDLEKAYLDIIVGVYSSGECEYIETGKELIYIDRVISTIRQIWDFEFQKYLEISADCPLCNHRFSPPTSVLDTIIKITKEASLTSEQSPCLELPDEAWEDPDLLSECPNCGQGLKFNPFIVGEKFNFFYNYNYKSETMYEAMNLKFEKEIQYAFDHFVSGKSKKEKKILKSLFSKKLEDSRIRIELARLALITDDFTRVKWLSVDVWGDRKKTNNNILARNLWFMLCLDFLNVLEKQNTGFFKKIFSSSNKEISSFGAVILGRLKTVLSKEDAIMEWTMQPVLDHLKSKLKKNHHTLLTALVAAISDKEKISELDKFEVWRNAKALSID